MFESIDDNNLDCQYRRQSTLHFCSSNSTNFKLISSKQNQSSIISNNSEANSSSFLKISSSNRQTNSSSPIKDHFVMTTIKRPLNSTQHISSNKSNRSIIINEELANNNKFLKNKMTAAFNHMKCRKLIQ